MQDLPFGIYSFRTRTITNCGPGTYSEPLTVQQQFVPEQMQPVTSAIEGCDVKFNWILANDGGLPILDYRLEV